MLGVCMEQQGQCEADVVKASGERGNDSRHMWSHRSSATSPFALRREGIRRFRAEKWHDLSVRNRSKHPGRRQSSWREVSGLRPGRRVVVVKSDQIRLIF